MQSRIKVVISQNKRDNTREKIYKIMLATLLWTLLISGTIENLTSTREITIVNPVHAEMVKAESEVNGLNSSTLREEYQGEKSNPSTLEIEDKPELSNIAKTYRLDSDKLNQTSSKVKKIADEMNFNWKIVMAIMLAESKGGLQMLGDNGLSRGYYHIYHINVCELNGNKPNCIKDADRSNLEASTRWTIKRLQRHSVLGENEMIRSHNGLVGDNDKDGYPDNQWYVDYIKKLVKEM